MTRTLISCKPQVRAAGGCGAVSRRVRRWCARSDPPCPACGRVPWSPGERGCDPLDVRGRSRFEHTWPGDDEFADPPPCACGTPVGGLHHWPCSIELCPWAEEHPDDGEQLMFCGCWDD